MNTMPDNDQQNRGRAEDFPEMIFRTSLVTLCAGLLLLLGCAAVKGPAPGDSGVDHTGRIAVFPVANLSNSPAPLAEIHRALWDKLKGQGFNVMAKAELDRLMERFRMRDTGSLSAVNARVFKEEAGASGVLITALELYDDKDPPKLALSARLVSTGENPNIEWAHSVALAGDDAPGLLGLGLIADPKVLLDKAMAGLAVSLASFASGLESDHDESSGKFKPKVNYVSSATGVGLRNVIVNFALRSLGRDASVSPARIDVSLSAPSPGKVTVEYAVTGGTAANGTDYTLKNGTLVFEPGELSKGIDIGIIDDKRSLGDRTIEVSLLQPVNAVLGKQTVHTYTVLGRQTVHTDTIIDNDPEPTVTFTSPGQEAQENGGSAVVTLQLSAVHGKDVIVPVTMSGTAVDGKNYRVMTPNPLTIKAGATTGDITVALMGDKRAEGNKTIIVTLGSPVNAAPGVRMSHTVTVRDADAPFRIAIMPFTNESNRKYAGEIMVLHFLREFIQGHHFAVVEPGLIIEKLLDYRIIMYEGISLSDADLIAGELNADLVLTGRVLDYLELAAGSGKPKVGFSLLLINRMNQQVVWSSSSRNEGDDDVYLFDWGRIHTAHALAAEMAGAIIKMIERQ